MTLQQRMKIDRDLRHKARRKIRVKADNGSSERTARIQIAYREKRALIQKKIEGFRQQHLAKANK